jgi:serine/threonine protein phosphatase 1
MVLSRLFRRTPAPAPRIAAVPDGERVYAIGDIHGRADLFDGLLDQIAGDDGARGQARTTIILLGDLVDRGPDSRGVVERAMWLKAEMGERLRWLVGNHEEVFLKALRGDPQVVRYFVRIGGEPTILSYGIDPEDYRAMEFDQLASVLPTLVPESHVRFLDAGEDRIVIGDYLFVHAGIRPGIAVQGQQVSDLRWIRDEFLFHRDDHDHVVVHGHTISDAPEDMGNRIGIDTGAYASGQLTALGLEGSDRWYLST